MSPLVETTRGLSIWGTGQKDHSFRNYVEWQSSVYILLQIREMTINNKSYLTKAFIFLFSLITEIYNNFIKQILRTLWITVTLYVNKPKLVIQKLYWKKLITFVKVLVPCHFWRTLLNCILINLWKKSNNCFNERPCNTRISTLLTLVSKRHKSLFL